VDAVFSDLRKVLAHDAVARLRHPVQILARGERVKADAEPAHAESLRDARELAHVRARLTLDAVDVERRRARELELAARLERDARPVLLEGDDRSALAFALGLPAVVGGEVDEDVHHLALVRDRREI